MGALRIDPEVPSFGGGVAHVWIERTAPADVGAARLAGIRIDGIAHRRGEAEEIPFAIACDSLPPAPAALLRAWIDVDGQGPEAEGDLFSTEAVPVSSGRCLVRVEDPAACAAGEKR